MMSMVDNHLPHLFETRDEPARRAPSRAVLKGIGRAIGMMCGPVDRSLPPDLASIVQRLPDTGTSAEPGKART